ncbi:hypothetical protein ACNKU7_06905 [Microbulbifer sp. SA54]|uniref:hypothetical protein n=1 Tax=Microbulbifer sp. SA54 TaxID=3401577 RepID=UPI003AAEB06A
MRLLLSLLIIPLAMAGCGDDNLDSEISARLPGVATAEAAPQLDEAASDQTEPVAVETTTTSASGKPNILLIVSDDTGYGDLGPYGGGEGRGMPTPNIDRMAAEGMTFFSFYAQPSPAARRDARPSRRGGFPTAVA